MALYCALTLALSCARFGPEGKRDTIDLTEDIYHRFKAGLLQIDREPIVCQLVVPDDGPNLIAGPAAMGSIIFVGEMGSWSVDVDEHGYVVMYLDQNIAMGHIRIGPSPSKAHTLSRWYREYPVHPIR